MRIELACAYPPNLHPKRPFPLSSNDRIVMMTNGPSAHVGEVLEVDLPHPRKRLELATNATYLKCRQRVLEFLYERHRFVEAA